MPNKKKTDQVDELLNILTSTPHFAVVKFDKTTHKSLEGLRSELRKTGEKLKIIKNTLFEKALEKFAKSNKSLQVSLKELLPLKENSAILSLTEEYTKGLSTFHTIAKKETTLSFKFGFLDKKIYDSSELKHIAQLPGKDILLGKILGSLKAPQSRIVYAMKFNISKLTYVLREQSKQGEVKI